MKKIKWHLLVIALFGICAGYVNKPQKLRTPMGQEMDTYQYWYSADGRMYYGYDLSSMGWVQGRDYDCVYPPNICTFIADPTRSHSDDTGNWFYASDVPQSGINMDGGFELMDE
jgi:hypothetical protein